MPRISTFATTLATLLLGCNALFVPVAAADDSTTYTLEKHDEGVRVLRDGKLVADYLTLSKSKPIIWPLLGPDETRMTRDYPMVPDSEDEAHDHPHHRSLWFTHGEVNGTDFWLEGGKGGITKHQSFDELSGGDQAVVATSNLWTTADGTPVLSDRRRFTFDADDSATWVDCEVLLMATHGDVNFGDTKEGTFGLRIAESMTVDAKQGGMLINSQGDKNGDAWGKAAKWVDYVGPIGGKTMGIAIFCHPTTYNYPNRWHVRTYGLFAANPFGVYHFRKLQEPTDGVDLASGESMLFRYRVLLHAGDTQAAGIEQRYREFFDKQFANLK